MKKQLYIQPQTSVVFLQSVSMLALSNGIDGENKKGYIPENLEEGDGSDAASRRQRTVWDEEW